MSKKQASQSVGVLAATSSTTEEPEVKFCPNCGDELPVDMPCQTCSGGAQPTEATETALAGPTAGATGGNGQTATPAQQRSSSPLSTFGGAEHQCPNCKGGRFFHEEVIDEEGKKQTVTVDCSRCDGRGYIITPLHSPVLAQERALVSRWPTEKLEINWPWVGEPDPVVGTVVGWNWQTKEVAVITEQPRFYNMKPWRVTIELKPMPEALSNCILIGVDSPVVHKNPVWYANWTRTGQKLSAEGAEQAEQNHESFCGKCIVQELS